jgi:hypothetical protein
MSRRCVTRNSHLPSTASAVAPSANLEGKTDRDQREARTLPASPVAACVLLVMPVFVADRRVPILAR